MKSAADVTNLIAEVKKAGLPASEACWRVALACVGWAYVFGSYGEYCDPTNRRSRYNGTKNKVDKENIKKKCKNFNGRDDVPSGCIGCQWFLGTAASNPQTHEGRTRFFDCRGFVYWVLNRVCGMWPKGCPAGCTSMWNNDDNWKEKGLVKDGVPKDVLVCLFYPKADEPRKMAHIGFGYNGQTVECSKGVEYHESYNPKWTHWAIPVCVDGADPDYRPMLRKGDKGAYVTLAQTELIQKGYDLLKYGADGDFGSETETAVKRFQTDHGLTADGVIGPKTWDALDQQSPVTILYLVTVPSLTKYQAEALLAQYPGSNMVEERR